MGGLYQGGYGGSGSDGGGTGSSKMEEEDPHWRPRLNRKKPAEEEDSEKSKLLFRGEHRNV